MPAFARITFTFLLVLLASNAQAGDAAIEFNIPAQNLPAALKQLAGQSQLQMLYDGPTVQGKHSAALKGRYTPQQALQTLLAGTGLRFVATGNNAVAVKPSTPQSSDTGSETTLGKVTVEADTEYDPEYYADPYNKDYVIPNATSGTKTDTPIMETPLNVQVISKQVLKDQQVISVDKALRNVSGVTLFTDNTNGSNLFLRGFESQTIFRNGVRFDNNGVGFGQQFANVESIEVLKGPAAILYGRVEPGGMLNVTTKQPLATPYYSLQQQFGSYDLYRTSVDATGPLTKDDTLLYRMNASFQSNNSFRDLNHGEDVFLAPILKWNISPRTQATLEMEYQHELSNLDQQVLPLVGTGTPSQHFIDLPHNRNLGERNRIENETIFVGLNWSHQFNDDWSLKHQVAFKRKTFTTGIMAFAVDSRPVDREVDRVPVRYDDDSRDTIATILDLTGHFNTWGLEHTLLFGGDYYRFNGFSDSTSDFENPSSPINFDNPVHPAPGLVLNQSTRSLVDYSFDNYGLYLQDQIKLPYNVHVMGGLRYQYVHPKVKIAGADEVFAPYPSQTDDAVTPRVGILWQPKRWLSLYSNYAENFGANNGQGLGGRPLPPQSAQQWEVGAKTEFFDGRLRATLAYYDLTKQNVATTDPANRLNTIAVGEVRSRGPELDIQGEILPGWNIIATYANQDVRVTKSNDTSESGSTFLVGNRLQNVPRNIGSFWTTYEVQEGDLKGFKIGGGVNLQDSMVDASNTLKSSGYTLVGLMTGYSFDVGKQTKINLQLNVDNLLDETYFTNVSASGNLAAGTFSTPRTFMGSINVQY